MGKENRAWLWLWRETLPVFSSVFHDFFGAFLLFSSFCFSLLYLSISVYLAVFLFIVRRGFSDAKVCSFPSSSPKWPDCIMSNKLTNLIKSYGWMQYTRSHERTKSNETLSRTQEIFCWRSSKNSNNSQWIKLRPAARHSFCRANDWKCEKEHIAAIQAHNIGGLTPCQLH